MVAAKNPELWYLKDYKEDIFNGKGRLKSFLLSDKVWKLRARDAQRGKTVAPCWKALLGYEWELRKEACHQINFCVQILVRGIEIADANLYTLEFTSSLSVDWNRRKTAVEEGGQKEEGDSKRRRG